MAAAAPEDAPAGLQGIFELLHALQRGGEMLRKLVTLGVRRRALPLRLLLPLLQLHLYPHARFNHVSHRRGSSLLAWELGRARVFLCCGSNTQLEV